MGKANTYGPGAVVIPVTSVVPAADATYDIVAPQLPEGTYHLSLWIKSAVTGTTTAIAVTPFVDEARSQLNNLAFRMYELDDTAAIAALTLPAGAAGRQVRIGTARPGIAMVTVPFGMRVAVTKGGATTGETLEIQLLATRVT